MKYKARYVTEHEIVFDASSVEVAAAYLDVKKPANCRVLGILPFEQTWPDQQDQTAPRPPRNTPPSGSPGTPTVAAPAGLVNAIAA